MAGRDKLVFKLTVGADGKAKTEPVLPGVDKVIGPMAEALKPKEGEPDCVFEMDATGATKQCVGFKGQEVAVSQLMAGGAADFLALLDFYGELELEKVVVTLAHQAAVMQALYFCENWDDAENIRFCEFSAWWSNFLMLHASAGAIVVEKGKCRFDLPAPPPSEYRSSVEAYLTQLFLEVLREEMRKAIPTFFLGLHRAVRQLPKQLEKLGLTLPSAEDIDCALDGIEDFDPEKLAARARDMCKQAKAVLGDLAQDVADALKPDTKPAGEGAKAPAPESAPAPAGAPPAEDGAGLGTSPHGNDTP